MSIVYYTISALHASAHAIFILQLFQCTSLSFCSMSVAYYTVFILFKWGLLSAWKCRAASSHESLRCSRCFVIGYLRGAHKATSVSGWTGEQDSAVLVIQVNRLSCEGEISSGLYDWLLFEIALFWEVGSSRNSHFAIVKFSSFLSYIGQYLFLYWSKWTKENGKDLFVCYTCLGGQYQFCHPVSKIQVVSYQPVLIVSPSKCNTLTKVFTLWNVKMLYNLYK